jgi:hypothetical protein
LAVNRLKLNNGFDLHDDAVVDPEVDSKAFIQLLIPIANWDDDLSQDLVTTRGQFDCETGFINGLQ